MDDLYLLHLLLLLFFFLLRLFLLLLFFFLLRLFLLFTHLLVFLFKTLPLDLHFFANLSVFKNRGFPLKVLKFLYLNLLLPNLTGIIANIDLPTEAERREQRRERTENSRHAIGQGQRSIRIHNKSRSEQ